MRRSREVRASSIVSITRIAKRRKMVRGFDLCHPFRSIKLIFLPTRLENRRCYQGLVRGLETRQWVRGVVSHLFAICIEFLYVLGTLSNHIRKHIGVQSQ